MESGLDCRHNALFASALQGLDSEPFWLSRCAGCQNAPLPAESHAANLTHFFPFASNGIRNRRLPKGGWSVAGIILRSVFRPSPQTTSTNSKGNVHSRSATIVR